MIRLHLLAAVATSSACCALALTSLVACSSDSSTDDGTSSSSSSSSSGGTTDAGKDTGTKPVDSGAEDTGAASVNSCKTFKDETAVASPRAIAWDFAVATAPERCMRIKLDQAVTWNGNFGLHPLAGQGGKSPNPINGADQTTSSAIVTFPTAGTYGFICTAHPAMQGAIEVVE